MYYEIVVSDEAKHALKHMAKSAPAAYAKCIKLFEELKEHPFEGTGHPEPLKGLGGTVWSRRIDKKNRLRYAVEQERVFVFVLSVTGHYDDK